MRAVRVALAAMVLCLLASTTVLAQGAQTAAPAAVPRVITLTGVFQPVDGQPPRAVETITVTLYAEPTGGDPLWQETQRVALDAQGRYALLLGATSADGIPAAVLAAGAQWLSTLVDRSGEVESPRMQLTSVPYALRAAEADTLGGRPASDYLLAAAPGDSGSAAAVSGDAPPGVSADLVLPGTNNFLAKYVNGGADVDDSAVFENGGRVGIGTTAPLDSLHINFADITGAVTGLAVRNLGNTATSYSGMLFYDQNGLLGQFQGFNNVTHEYRINNIASGGSINFMIGSSSKFLVANNGAIGIGAPTGTAKLTVRANPSFTATGTVSTTAGSGVLTGLGTRFLTELNAGDRVTIGGTTLAVASVTTDTLASISTFAPTVAGAMTVLPGMLRVQNSAGNLVFQVNDAGNVAIGTSVTSGSMKLHVSDGNRFSGTSIPASTNNGNVTIITTTTQAADVGAVLALGGSRGSTGVASLAGIRGAKENGTDAEPSGYLGLYTVDTSNTFAERMRVTSTGSVGIGTKTPARELEVNGGVRMNTVAARPACDATVRGTFWVTQGGAGIKDSVEVCAKDASNVFAWRTLF